MLNQVSKESIDLTQQNIEKLKELFPEILTDGNKIDFDMLQTILGEQVDGEKERYSFTWPGKRDAINGARQPSKGTLRPNKEKSKNFDTTENLYIEGDNLEVLKLLQKSYNNKIKVIYIDPPYNTGKDFVYKDNFRDGVGNYLEQTGQVDSEGNLLSTNSESNGRFHTDWLNMIYPRIRLARNLMSDDGIVFISINDTEKDNLVKICNQIFGEKNFVANLVWTNKEGGGSSDSKLFRIKHEYVVCYAKAIDNLQITGIPISNLERYRLEDQHLDKRGPYYLQKLGMGSIQYSSSLDYPIKTPEGSLIYPRDNNSGKKACWRWSQTKLKWGFDNDFVVFRQDKNLNWIVYTKQYLKMDNDGNYIERTQRPMGVIDKFSSTQSAKYLEKLGLGNIFNYSKPKELIKYLIERVDNSDSSIVLDFFSGSGTTADAVLELNADKKSNRKFIVVQLPEKIDEIKVAEEKIGTISEIGAERIRRAGSNLIANNPDLENKFDIGFKYLQLDKSNIKEWNTDFDNLENEIDLFAEVFVDGRSELDVVYEIMLKNGLELTLPVNTFEVDGKKVYDIAFGLQFICLSDNIDTKIAKAIIDKRDEYGTDTISGVVFKDAGFNGNDSEKLNCIQLLKDAGFIEENLQTI